MATWILLIVLGAIILFVTDQVRRELQSKWRRSQPAPLPPEPLPPQVPLPALEDLRRFAVQAVPEAVAPVTPIVPNPVPLPAKTNLAPAPNPKGTTPLPVATTPASIALELLKKPQTQAAAFLLREIFDGPLSRRRR